MSSFADFKDFYARHKDIIAKYEAKRSYVETLLETKAESADPVEQSILETWLQAGSTWLRDNEEEYNKATTISKLCESDVNSVFELYDSIYSTQ
jgi:hypothetical protein